MLHGFKIMTVLMSLMHFAHLLDSLFASFCFCRLGLMAMASVSRPGPGQSPGQCENDRDCADSGRSDPFNHYFVANHSFDVFCVPAAECRYGVAIP
jgi:hypothetical protein